MNKECCEIPKSRRIQPFDKLTSTSSAHRNATPFISELTPINEEVKFLIQRRVMVFTTVLNTILFSILLLFSFNSFSQTCVGKWVAIDDQTNKKSSMVELYKIDGKLYGKVIFLYPKEGREANPKCTKCTDDRKNKSLLGLQVIRGLVWNGSEWSDGTFVDWPTGKTYKLKIWLDPDNSNYLNVRGYLGLFFRTQTWVRVVD